jgi:hypothetical protein
MAFLNPALLWALLALAVPILVHLFNFRKPRRLLFSNLAFVREVNRSVVKRIKLKQWLLLLLRCLAVAAAVLAFAGPVLRQDASGPMIQSDRSVLILLDNSYSMRAEDARGNYWQQSLQLAREIIRNHGRNDEFQLQLMSELRLNAPYLSQGQALEALDNLTEGDRFLTQAQFFRQLPNLLGTARNPSRNVYVISDFQRSTILADTLQIPPDLGNETQVFYLPIGQRRSPNVYISDARFTELLVEPGKPIEVALVLNNDGPEAIKQLTVRLEVEGKAVAIQSVEIPADGRQETTLTFTPQASGWQSGVVRVDDPAMDFDNERFFTFYVPQKTRVLLVEGSRPATYLRKLFQQVETVRGQFETTVISDKQLAGISLADYSVVILAGLREVSSGMQEKLNAWVRQGGGLLTFPGDDMQTQSVNGLYAALEVGQFGTAVRYTEAVPWRTPDLSHPLFAGVYQKSKPNSTFDPPILQRVQTFTPNKGGVQASIIYDKKGQVLVHERQVELGRVLTFALQADLSWGDFPIKSIFAPLVYRSVLLLSHSTTIDFSQTLGATQVRRIRTGSRDLVKLRPMQGPEIVPEQSAQAGQVVLQFDRSELQAGIYDIVQRDSLLEKIAFNLADAESRLAAPDEDELRKFLEAQGLGSVQILKAAPEQMRARLQEASLGVPLWKYFLVFALLCLVAEVALLRLMK